MNIDLKSMFGLEKNKINIGLNELRPHSSTDNKTSIVELIH